MTHSEIEAFFEIIRAGSISGAAENLYITQPALSRRIKALEKELGYCLFTRNKGQKQVELTPKGEAFVPVAHKWLSVRQEALEIKHLDSSHILNIAAIGSVSSYILPHVFKEFTMTSTDARICFHNYHSFEAYRYVADGTVDVALISDDMYFKNVETFPLYRDPMVLVANTGRTYPQKVHPHDLDPGREILLPWNPEFDVWHDYWFKAAPKFNAFLDQMSLLEYVLSWKDTWAVAPTSVAHKIAHLEYVSVHELISPPPDRIIYYIKRSCSEIPLAKPFFELLHRELLTIPGVTSYLPTQAVSD